MNWALLRESLINMLLVYPSFVEPQIILSILFIQWFIFIDTMIVLFSFIFVEIEVFCPRPQEAFFWVTVWEM